MATSASKDRNSSSATAPNAPLTEKTILAAHEAIDRLSSRLAKAEDSLRHVAAESGETLSEKQAEVKIKVESTLENAKTFTQENPIMATGIAFAAGVLIANLLRR